MNNPTSFVVNTGTQEGDQHEIARYQQYYQAQGVVLAAQPQPQGGFLLTTYQPHQVGAAPKPAPAAQPEYRAAPKQDIGATQHGYAGPEQYPSSPPAGYGAAPQQYPGAAQPAPQQYGVGTQAGYGAAAPQYAAAQAAPQQYGAAMQPGYGAAPAQYGGAAQAAPQAYGAATQAGYGASPQQYAGAAQPDYGAPPQQYAGAAQPDYGASPQQYAGAAQPDYGASPQQYAGAAQPDYGAPPQQYAGAAQPDYGAPQQYAGAAQPDYGAPPQQYAGAAQPDYGAPQQYAGAAPAAYPQGSNPGYGTSFPQPGAAFGAPTAQRSGLMGALGNLTVMQKLKFAGTAVFVLGMAGFSFFLLRQAQSNIVLFENSLDVAGELSLAGKTYGSISPRQALRVELDAGNYEVSFTGNGAKLDGGTLSVPKGNGAVGYRAVYNLGGKKGIAVVTKYYGGSFEDTVKPVAEGTRVVEVPGAQKLDRLDEGFPDSVTVPKHQTFATLVHVCHVDEAKGTVGCPGW